MDFDTYFNQTKGSFQRFVKVMERYHRMMESRRLRQIRAARLNDLVKQVATLWPTLNVFDRIKWSKAVTHAMGTYPEGQWLKGLGLIQKELATR